MFVCIYLSIHLSIHPSIYLSIYLPIHLSISCLRERPTDRVGPRRVPGVPHLWG